MLALVVLMLTLFLWGDELPVPIRPGATALAAAALSLAVVHRSRVVSVERLLSRIDWSTLLYFIGLFVLIGGLERQGVLALAAAAFSGLISGSAEAGTRWLLLSTAAASSLVPNTPLLATLTPVLSGFFALMLGVTLRGSATMIGAWANLVAAGIGRQEGCPISFRLWFGFGIPTVLMQLAASALWLQQWPAPAG
ncbi:MAG: hypothetical protein NTW83_07425 [Cyanobacteria bacterium]|nr:hypothetical protein [Cyanobacteriota bacterium]